MMPGAREAVYVRLTLSLLLSLAFAACWGSDDSGSSGSSSEITPLALASMTLDLSDFGPEYENLRLHPDSGLWTNRLEPRRTSRMGVVDTTVRQLQTGRLSGYARLYMSPVSATEANEVWIAGTYVEAFPEQESAHEAWQLARSQGVWQWSGAVGDISTYVRSRDFFFEGLGDEAAGIEAVVSPQPGAAGRHYYWSYVLLQRGNLVGRLIIVRPDSHHPEYAVRALTEKLDQRMAEVSRKGPRKGVELSARDVLAAAEDQMSRLSSTHLLQTQKWTIDGFQASLDLEADVEFPDRATGQLKVNNRSFDILLLAANSYARLPGAAWQCFEDSGYGARNLGLVPPDFTSEVSLLGLVDEDSPATIASAAGQYVIAFRIDALDYFSSASKLLSAAGPAQDGEDILGGTASIELRVNRADFVLQEYSVDLEYETIYGRQAKIASDVMVSDFNQPITFPARGELPGCEGYDPPCSGRNLDLCLSPSQELQEPRQSASACDSGERRVCIVPLGAVDPEMIQGLVAYYSRNYALDVRLLPAISIAKGGMDQEREQFEASILFGYMHSHYRQAMEDRNVVVLGITSLDIYASVRPEWDWVFAQRFGQGDDYRFGVISTFHMNPQTYGEPPDSTLLLDRLRKMVSRYIAAMYLRLPDSNDPSNLMYTSVTSLSALDRLVEDLPVSR